MIRSRSVLAFVLLPLLFCALTPAQSTSPADDILVKAIEQSRLRYADAPPFAIEAKIRMAAGKQQREGYYSVKWLAPTRWRDTLTIIGYSQTRVADGALVKSTQFESVDLFQLSTFVSRFYPDNTAKLQEGEKVKSVREVKIDGVDMRLVELHGRDSKRQLFFDAKTGLLMRSKTSRSSVTYDDYVQFNGKWIAKHYKFEGSSAPTVEFFVQRLESLAASQDIDTAMPADTRVAKGCEFPKPAYIREMRQQLMPSNPLQSSPAIHKPLSLVITVGNDGRPRDVRVLESGGIQADLWMKDLAMASSYEPSRCEGEPVEGETMFGILNR